MISLEREFVERFYRLTMTIKTIQSSFFCVSCKILEAERIQKPYDKSNFHEVEHEDNSGQGHFSQ